MARRALRVFVTQSRFNAVPGWLEREAQRAVDDTAADAKRLARALAPRWSGDLESSIGTLEAGQFRTAVQATVPYARRIHEGEPKRPFLTRAIELVKTRWLARGASLAALGTARILLPPLPSVTRFVSLMAQRGIPPRRRRFARSSR